MLGLRSTLVLALLGCGACGASAPTKAPVVEPAAQPTEQQTPPAAEGVGTGSALGESTEPPAGHVSADAGPHPEKPTAPDAKPKK